MRTTDSAEILAPRAVLWDMDGTLVDSREYHWRAWQTAMADERLSVTKEQFLASFGQRNDTILSGWLGPAAEPELTRRIGDAKEAEYRKLVADEGIEFLPGAGEWMRALRRAGWRQAIASAAPRLNVEAIVRALELTGLLDALVSAEDVRAGKPDPDVFLIAATRVGVPPERCVVVEDAAAGIEAGRRAGMRCIGVGGDALRAADVVVPALDRLAPDAFDRLIGGG
jgi:HAD superfamily hydrolase (TIGR01509 family)